jgi:hypothetical protein
MVWSSIKSADTFRAAVMVTVQVPVPEHPSPDHPMNFDPEPADAVRITWVL